MANDDSIVLCGEWETGMADVDASGGKYNIRLPILDIVKHPNYDPTVGPVNGNDQAKL